MDNLRCEKYEQAVLAKTGVYQHMEKRHAGKLEIYTDGSVNRSSTSSTAALYLPKEGMVLSGKLQKEASSTTTELLAEPCTQPWDCHHSRLSSSKTPSAPCRGWEPEIQ